MRLLFAILFLIFFQNLKAQNNSLLWEVTGKDLKETSYLYGTFHVRDERVFRFGDSVMVKFNSCKAMAGEIQMDSLNPMERARELMMPSDTTLEMLLTPEQYKMVKQKAKEKLGFLAAAIDKIKPIFTSALITEMDTDADSTEALDSYLQKIARVKKMKVFGIESVEEQFAAINKISLKEQADMLYKSLTEEAKQDTILNQMFEVYLAQDLDRMENLLKESEMTDVMNQSLIIHRNYVMAERIENVIHDQSTFIAIGTAHLVGKEGLIQLLRNKGYQVRPVFSNYHPTHATASNVNLANGQGASNNEIHVKDKDNWYIYSIPENKLNVKFPADFEERKPEHMILSIEPKSGVLYALTQDTIGGESAEEFFKNEIEQFKKAELKVISEKRTKINGFPVLQVNLTESGMDMIINFYYISPKKVVELSVTGDKKNIHNSTAKKFFNSIKMQ
jgi:hypothetical protein